MESELFDYEQLRASESFGIKRYKESIYRGELVDGKRQGLGAIQYRTCRIYEG